MIGKSHAKHWVIDAMQDYRESAKIHYGGIADREHLTLQEQIDEYQQTAEQLETLISQVCLTNNGVKKPSIRQMNRPTSAG